MRSRLRPGEDVEAVVRRHWIVLSVPMGTTLFMGGSLVGLWIAGRPLILPVVGVLLAVAGGWALWRYLDWRCDLWAVTPLRVIDESGVLSVRIVDSPLETIHNIGCQRSFLGRVLGYGTLNIQTAAEQGMVTIEAADDPDGVREMILELKEKRRGAHPAGDGPLTAGPSVAPGPRAETKECPFCAETIKSRAKICRFCGRDVA